MSLSILIDMNLSMEWVQVLEKAGWAAVHWSSVGAVDAEDQELMAWASAHKHVVFTHDLDFGTALALTHTSAPTLFRCAAKECYQNVSVHWCWRRSGNMRQN